MAGCFVIRYGCSVTNPRECIAGEAVKCERLCEYNCGIRNVKCVTDIISEHISRKMRRVTKGG